MGSERNAHRARMPGHGRDVALHQVEVEHQGGRVEPGARARNSDQGRVGAEVDHGEAAAPPFARPAVSAWSPMSRRWQATWWPGFTSCIKGSSILQRAIT